MVLGRGSQRDQRRRRALADDRRAPSPPSPSGRGDSSRASRRYTDAAHVDQQPPISSLIPVRTWTVLVWALMVATILAAHATLAHLEYEARMRRLPIDLAPLNLERVPSLYRLTGALALLAAAAYGVQILTLRRHKIDDYRGRYRLWYPVILGLTGFGVAYASGLSQSVSSAATWLAQLSGLSTQSMGTAVSFSLVSTLVVVRLLFEVYPSRLAVSGLLTATVCFATSTILAADVIQVPAAELHGPSVSLLWLSGCLMTLMTAVGYSRYVFLDAQGQIPHAVATVNQPSKKRNRGEKAAKPTPTPERTSKSKTAETKKKPKLKVAKTDENEAAESDKAADADESQDPRLSRAERRRLRKEKRRQNLAA